MINVNIFDRSDTPLPASRAQIRRWVRSALRGETNHFDLNISWVDNAEAKHLNKQFRQKTYAPNVLTFALDDTEADVVICADVLIKEAKKQRKSVSHHFAHLVIHGALHSVGFDHEIASEAEKMETLEAQILKRFAIKNPYLST